MRVGLYTIGNSVIRSVRSYFRMISFFGVLILALTQFRRCIKRFNRYEFLIHSYQYGPRILPKITLFAVIVSSFICLFTIRELNIYHALNNLGAALALLLIREVGPLMIAFFVIIYASIAIFDELEDIKEHLSKSDNLADESYEFIDDEILPRFAAIILCMPLLYFYFSLVSFFIVSFWVNASQKISLHSFYSQISVLNTNHDVIIGLIKTVLFAAINAFFACFYGLQHEPDPEHKSLPLVKSILVNLGYLIFTDALVETVAYQMNY